MGRKVAVAELTIRSKFQRHVLPLLPRTEPYGRSVARASDPSEWKAIGLLAHEGLAGSTLAN